MNFEVVQGKYEQKNLELIANGQVKVPARVDLQTAAKKILHVTSNCFIGAVERTETDIKVNGKVTTRVVYIDEFDAYNSDEREHAWTEKFAPKSGADVLSVAPSAYILEMQDADYTKNEEGLVTEVQTNCVVNVTLMGLTGKEMGYVQDLKGDVETKCEKTKLSAFGHTVSEKFDSSETFTLDAGVEGILGVDLNAAVRDISCTDGRMTVKGVISANANAVKTVDGASVIYSTTYDWDFTKSFNNKDINADDIVCGAVALCGSSVKVENRDKPEIVIEAELLFTGHVVQTQEIEVVEDAFAYDNDLDFAHSEITDTRITPQMNVFADVEGNTTMPEGSPFIGKVLSVCGMSINTINAVATEGKVTIEGVLNAHMVYECEERNVYSHTVQVPFSTGCKIDDCTKKHNIFATVTPVSCNIKARRGKELLVDARVCISVSVNIAASHKFAAAVNLGEAKKRDDSAITIHIADERETLWDIAKRTSLPSAEICKQNPNIENGVTSGERIVLYRQEVINF